MVVNLGSELVSTSCGGEIPCLPSSLWVNWSLSFGLPVSDIEGFYWLGVGLSPARVIPHPSSHLYLVFQFDLLWMLCYVVGCGRTY